MGVHTALAGCGGLWHALPRCGVPHQRTLEGLIGNIRCPYLVVNGKLDAQTAYTNTEELAREAEAAGVDVTYVLYEEGSHVCFNIPYMYRPLVGDWMADRLLGR
jgi:2,6-dihydroxypseudooxynicotine hydrolase